MLRNILLAQLLCAFSALANSQSACWMPVKDFSSEKQEPQGKEAGRDVHAARHACPPGKTSCNQAIVKWYPSLVTDIKAHKGTQVLTYPAGTMSWISSTESEGNERFLIVGTGEDGRDMRLCRATVRTHLVIGTHSKGDTICTVNINGKQETHEAFELLLINKHGKSVGIKKRVAECPGKHHKSDPSSWEDDSSDEGSDSGKVADVEGGHDPNRRNKPQSKPGMAWTVDKHHRQAKTIEWSDSLDRDLWDMIGIFNVEDDFEDFEGYKSSDKAGGRQHYQMFSNKQPCWSDFEHGTQNYEGFKPIGFENHMKVYLARWMSKGGIMFGTFCPSQNKLVVLGGKQPADTKSVQLLSFKHGTLGWTLTSQSIYRWKIPRNALIVGKCAGLPYALHKEPTYYTICRPDLSLGMNGRKLLLGVANSQTGLCTTEFGGQVVHFTRFHILTQLHATAGPMNAVETCSSSGLQERAPTSNNYHHSANPNNLETTGNVGDDQSSGNGGIEPGQQHHAGRTRVQMYDGY